MDKLFLKKDLVTGITLTQDGVLAYIALRIIMDESILLYNKTSVVDCISVNRMAYALIGSQEKYEKVFLGSLQRGIYELQLANVIRILQNFSTKTSNEYLLDFSNLYLDTEKEQFVTISSEEIYKILACEEIMKKKISMLKYFVAIGREPVYIETDNVSHGECNHKLFCVNGNDSDYIDIEDLY